MSVVASVLMVFGALIALLAGIGLLRFESSYARFHAAGKASPVALIVATIGAALQLDTAGAAYLLIAPLAMALTLPVGVHLLFRAHHRTSSSDHMVVDELREAELRYGRR